MKIKVIDEETNEVIGTVVTNQSLTFDRTLELAGLSWLTSDKDGVECDGWYKEEVLYDAGSCRVVYC